MFTVTPLLWLFVGLLLALQLFKKRGLKYPPGPFRYPLIGNLLQLGSRRPEVVFMEWAKDYGKIFGVKMGTQNVVILDDYKLIKEAFGDPAFSGKPINPIVNFSSRGPYGVISSQGEVWENQRRFMLRNLRDFGFGKSSMETLIMEEVKEVLEHFESQEGTSIGVDHTFGLAVLNSLWTIACGQRFSQKNPTLKNMLSKMTVALKVTGESGIIFAPWLRYIIPELSGYNKLMKCSGEWNSVFEATIREHIKTYSDDHSRDFIDQFIKEINKTTDPNSSFYNKDGAGGKNLFAVVGDIFVAGTETAATVLNWTMLYLSERPKSQQKLHEEINRIIGNSRLPSLSDRAKLPFAEATMMEVLRFSSMVPLGAPHTTMSDVEFNGYRIPKGTWVLGNLYSVHNNPEIWGDPENFRPERFLSPDGKTVQKHEALIPFQAGKRQCLGESLARDTLFLFIVSVFQRFEVISDPKHLNSNFEAETAFIRYSKPFKVFLKDRLKY